LKEHEKEDKGDDPLGPGCFRDRGSGERQIKWLHKKAGRNEKLLRLMSLERLSELRVEALYPGQGRISTAPQEDLQKALENARTLLDESKMLFEALDTKERSSAFSFPGANFLCRQTAEHDNIWHYSKTLGVRS
jgi:hypothetical protein